MKKMYFVKPPGCTAGGTKLLRMTKLIVILLAACGLSLTASAKSQRLDLQIKNGSLVDVFDAIEEQSDYRFAYSADFIEMDHTISLNVQNEEVTEVLAQLLDGTDYMYRMKDDLVVFYAKEKNEATLVQDEKVTIKGVVKDAEGEPLPGVTIIEKGTTNGSISGIDGSYVIRVNSGSELQYTFIGFVSQEVQVTGQSAINITLLKDVTGLDEVVVTAFGTGQKKESVVGSIQSVRPDDLIMPTANLSNAFAGRLSGVIAVQRSGEPGADGSNFYIRGISTLNGATNPLIIIDGVESTSNSLNALPPEVIESFSILKDATATAMYGTRGANGVLIIATKGGADLKKPVINIRIENAFNQPTSMPDFVSGKEYMIMYNEAVGNQSLGERLYTQEEIENTGAGVNPYLYPNVNWYDEIFRSTSLTQNANFNVRGGGKKLDYFMNVGYTHQDGMVRGRSEEFFSYNNSINYHRYNFQNNINLRLSESSKIGLRLNTQLTTKRSPSKGVSSLYSSVINTSPVLFPVMMPDNESITITDGQGGDWIYWGNTAEGNSMTNPLAELVRGYSESFTSNITANLDFEQKLDFVLKGLTFKSLVSFRNNSTSTTKREQGYTSYRIAGHSQDSDGTYSYIVTPLGAENAPVLGTSGSITGNRRVYFQSYFNYDRKFGQHDVSAMLLYNQDQDVNNKVSDLMSSLPLRRQGIAARASYAYDSRYMFEFNLGYNGSENFAKGHRWGFFPAVALGYNVSRESFFAPLTNVVSNLKLRASYGLVGNDRIGSERFIYLSDVDLNGSEKFKTGYGSTTEEMKGPSYNRYANNAITWEVGHKLNVGMDLQLFRDLNIVMDVFREERENIFQQKNTIPNYLGVADSKVYGNLAKMRNQGFDMAIDYGKIIGDWTIRFKGTFTYAANVVLEYDEAAYMEYPHLRMVGSYANRLTGYVSDNLFIDWNHIAKSPDHQISENVAPGDIKYLDQPNAHGEYDGIINSNDKVTMGHPKVPEIVYGFGPSFKYKNLDFSCFFQGVANTSLMMSGFHPFGTQNSRNVLQFIADDYWSPNNQNIYAAYPRLTKVGHGNNSTASDFWLRDASFLKLKNAEIGYTYKKMRIYLSGLNLLTFSSFKHWDPEQGGGSGLKYPTQRSFNVGLQLSL